MKEIYRYLLTLVLPLLLFYLFYRYIWRADFFGGMEKDDTLKIKT
jgi:hypothetical protein